MERESVKEFRASRRSPLSGDALVTFVSNVRDAVGNLKLPQAPTLPEGWAAERREAAIHFVSSAPDAAARASRAGLATASRVRSALAALKLPTQQTLAESWAGSRATAISFVSDGSAYFE